MSIIGNVGHPTGDVLRHVNVASAFLYEFEMAQQKMKSAADLMLKVSKIAATTEDRKRYDGIHKEMVRQIREWNKLEQKREQI